MNTEITDNVKFNGWVLYDGNCRYCTSLAKHFHPLLARHRFTLAPLQTPWIREQLGLNEAELLAEMRLLRPNGNTTGGADALLEISRQFWWAWPLRQFARIPAVMNLLRAAYRWVARHRNCVNGECSFGERPPRAQQRTNYLHAVNSQKQNAVNSADILPLLFLPLLALLCQPYLPAWVFMWAMAFALYAGCKWLTYRLAVRVHGAPAPLLKYGYLLVWPGMNAADFFNRKHRAAKPPKIEWAFATLKTILGGVLLFAIARLTLPFHPLLAGWIGMTGAIFILHFGLFHLLSLAWRQAGVNAPPLMQNPLKAASLGEFWGARWNTAFNELAFRFTFRPLRRRTTPAVATLAVFGLSGLVHELVISLPAHGGYGLPTLYFLAQGFGLIIERSPSGRHLGLGVGIRGWLFALLITAGPACWLFHPPFIHNVILPMLTAIGAT